MALEGLGKVFETDVLVIGCGIAGAFAAIKAKETHGRGDRFDLG